MNRNTSNQEELIRKSELIIGLSNDRIKRFEKFEKTNLSCIPLKYSSLTQ